jgi:hypothetical protein
MSVAVAGCIDRSGLVVAGVECFSEADLKVARKKMVALSRSPFQPWQIPERGAFHPAMAEPLVVTNQPICCLDGRLNQIGILAAPLLEG